MPINWYVNHYYCERCKVDWQSENDSECDDRCPECDVSHSPHKSEKVKETVDK